MEISAVQHQPAKRCHQVLYARYFESEKILKYLGTLYPPGTYELKIRRGKYILELPYRLSPEELDGLQKATLQSSNVSLAESQAQAAIEHPSELIAMKVPAATPPAPGKVQLLGKIRRRFMEFIRP